VKEDFLHYVWQYKKFAFSNLTTVSGELLTIVSGGQYLKQAGPDFFNAQLIIGSQKWAGNVEIHVKSSDWYLHGHEQDELYDNVILHVVWEHDAPVFRRDNSELPVLVLRDYVSKSVLDSYQRLVTPKTWIYCESQIKGVGELFLRHWMERLFFERLERKSIPIKRLLTETVTDWEAVLFYLLAKNFGLNTNGAVFLKVAQSVPFAVIRKERFDLANLEALFFGQADLLPLEAEDTYVIDLKKRYDYLVHKHQLQKPMIGPVAFFKHRPDNFPTIRLAQLAMLYHQKEQLFSEMLSLRFKAEVYELFRVSVSSYWQVHYQFGKESPKKSKTLSNSFIELLTINTLVPFQFAYASSRGQDVTESIVSLLQTIVAEKNSIIEKFTNFGVPVRDAFATQSLLQLKQEYCNHGKCMHCAIGLQLLKS
jgi:hypothetical protein